MAGFFSSPHWREVEIALDRLPAWASDGTARWLSGHAPVRLLQDRMRCIREACNRADHETERRLLQMFDDLDLRDILSGLIDTLKEAVLIVGASVGVGTALGAGLGSLAGGIGALPGGAAGAALGTKVGLWILAALGLKSLLEFFIEGLPAVLGSYRDGFVMAWQAGRDPVTDDRAGSEMRQSAQIHAASFRIAEGHVAVVILLLSAIVAYLLRGRSMQALAQEARAGRLGDKFANWMLSHEDKLRRHPKLQPRAQRPTGSAGPDGSPPRQNKAAEAKAALMPQKRVRCFETNGLPKDKFPEFDRQLKGQQAGLNEMTVEEYLKGREAFGKGETVRDWRVAQAARELYENELVEDLVQQFRQQGLGSREAYTMATEAAGEKMKTLAALHNPDLTAGGRDVIADFGDRNVNSRIGAQWPRRGRLSSLDDAAAMIPSAERGTMLMNVKLERC